MNETPNVFEQLIDTTRRVAARGWSPATGGNYSVRLSDGNVCITASGRDKNLLGLADLLTVDLQGQVLFAEGDARPSAETRLHTALYSLDDGIGAVLHSHSVSATVLSRQIRKKWWKVSGYEMQKALDGITSHHEVLRLRLLDNHQDMESLVERLSEQWDKEPLRWGFLLRGHGLYAWGKDLAEARRHLEGLEFLMACDLAERAACHGALS